MRAKSRSDRRVGFVVLGGGGGGGGCGRGRFRLVLALARVVVRAAIAGGRGRRVRPDGQSAAGLTDVFRSRRGPR